MILFDRIFGKKNAHINGDFVSHIGQDMWVSEVFGNKKCGYFLDFGAFDGILTSEYLFSGKAAALEWYMRGTKPCILSHALQEP